MVREKSDLRPLLKPADRATSNALARKDRLSEEFVATLEPRPPIPKKMEWVDFHKAPQPVVSEKIANVIAPLRLKHVQLVRANIQRAAVNHEYWVLHVIRLIPCLDRKKSVVETSSSGAIIDIEKLALDESVLDEIPEPERRLFILGEDTSVYILDKTLADGISAVRPVGLKLYHTDQWHGAIAFE